MLGTLPWPVASYEVLQNKHTLPDWTCCTTFKAVMHKHPLKPTLVSPTAVTHPSVGNLKPSASRGPHCTYFMHECQWESIVLLKYAVYLYTVYQ
jgi:hypothetical protein